MKIFGFEHSNQDGAYVPDSKTRKDGSNGKSWKWNKAWGNGLPDRICLLEKKTGMTLSVNFDGVDSYATVNATWSPEMLAAHGAHLKMDRDTEKFDPVMLAEQVIEVPTSEEVWSDNHRKMMPVCENVIIRAWLIGIEDVTFTSPSGHHGSEDFIMWRTVRPIVKVEALPDTDEVFDPTRSYFVVREPNTPERRFRER